MRRRIRGEKHERREGERRESLIYMARFGREQFTATYMLLGGTTPSTWDFLRCEEQQRGVRGRVGGGGQREEWRASGERRDYNY